MRHLSANISSPQSTWTRRPISIERTGSGQEQDVRPPGPKTSDRYQYENQFWNPGFINGVRQFCVYQFFCYEIFFYLVSSYSQFLSNLLNQNLQNVKTPKRKPGSFVQRYSFKFQALIRTPYFCSLNNVDFHLRFLCKMDLRIFWL